MWILLAIIAIIPFEKNPYLYLSQNFLGVFPDFRMIKLLGLIGLGWSFFQIMGGQAQFKLFESKQARVFLLYLGTVVFALIASEAGIRQLTRYLSIVFFLPLVLTAIRTEGNLRLALTACAGTLILVFPYAYRQVLRFGGRLGVGLYEPNYFALALVLMLPLAFIFARQESVGWKRLFWTGGIGVLLLEIILTASRGAFLGLIVILPLIALRLMKHRMLTLAVVACLLLVPVYLVPTTLGQRLLASGLDSGVQDAGISASNRTRRAVLQGGIRMMLDNPLTGVGLGNFKANIPRYTDHPVAKIAHSTYVQLGAELGLPALAAFLWLLYVTFASLRHSARLATSEGRRDLAELAIALQIGLAGYLVSAFFLSAQFEKFFWLVVFLSICFERVVVGLAKKDAELEGASEQVSEQSLALRIQ